MIFDGKCLGLFNISRKICNNLYKYGYVHLKGWKWNSSRAKMDTDIVWIDLEMTGLDVNKDKIIEVGCLITNSNLQIRSTEFHTIIHQPDELMNSMDDWCAKTHRENGLIDAVKNSKVTMVEAEEELLNFIMKYIKNKNTSPLAGNSIYMDRLFIGQQMPRVNEYLHHRIIDVSSIKELAERWYPDIVRDAPRKKIRHRAIDDIKESIAELEFYKENLFKN